MRERLGSPSAEGATAPETLRQKDRFGGRDSGEQGLSLYQPLTEGESRPCVGVTGQAKTLRFLTEGAGSVCTGSCQLLLGDH